MYLNPPNINITGLISNEITAKKSIQYKREDIVEIDVSQTDVSGNIYPSFDLDVFKMNIEYAQILKIFKLLHEASTYNTYMFLFC